VVAVVADAADLWTLFHVKDNDLPLAFLGSPRRAASRFEELRVPQSLEITAQRLFVDTYPWAEDAARLGVSLRTLRLPIKSMRSMRLLLRAAADSPWNGLV